MSDEEAIGWVREVVLDGEPVSPRPGPDGEPVPWRVYRDPAGHSFCLVVR
jgi:hypothetical protein